MKYTYAYKTSDGARHEAAMEAASREAVFEALRAQGIKAIKVVAADGSKANGEETGEGGRESTRTGAGEYSKRTTASGGDGKHKNGWAAIVVFVALAGCAWWWLGGRGAADKPVANRVDARPPVGGASHEGTRHDGSPAASYRTAVDRQRLEGSCASYREIVEEVDAACEAYRVASTKIDFELLANYALVERVKDTAEFRAIIAHGREVVSNAREAVRRSFSVHYDGIPPSRPDDRDEAQRLYGLVMDELDAADERLESDECALSLLEANRGKWRVVKGAVIWDDPKLERQFRIFGREPSAAATRWERDFGRGRIESAPVALPSAPAAK